MEHRLLIKRNEILLRILMFRSSADDYRIKESYGFYFFL